MSFRILFSILHWYYLSFAYQTINCQYVESVTKNHYNCKRIYILDVIFKLYLSAIIIYYFLI